MRPFATVALSLALTACAGRDRGPATNAPTAPAVTAAPDRLPAAVRPVLPITAITLRAGGAAYVEHVGHVSGDATVQLHFKPGQLSGAMKSLMISDESGRPATIERLDGASGPASRPARVDLNASTTLVELLQQVRGSQARIELRGSHSKLVPGNESLEATILSVEKKQNGPAEMWQLNVLSGNTIRALPVESVQKIELTDPRAQREIKSAMESLWQTSDQDRRTIAINLRGQGERMVHIGYAVELPSWKVNYRLLLGDKPTIQAWAEVSNDGDADWKNVRLTLVSDRPLTLPANGTQLESSIISRAVRGGGVPAGELLRQPKPTPTREALDGPQTPGGVRGGSDVAPLLSPAEAFCYELEDVTISRGGTMSIPVLSGGVTVERVAVFTEGLHRRNPLQGARLRNATKQFLLGGPVAVFDDGRYAGDGTLDALAPGRQCLVSWGMDLPLLVDASVESASTSTKQASLKDGVLFVTREYTYTKEYAIENQERADRAVIVEHPIRRGWALVGPADVLEVTESVYRFRCAVPAGKRTTLVVKECMPEIEPIELAAADAATLHGYAQDAALSASVREALTKVMPLKQRLVDREQQGQQKQAELDRLTAEQSRIRDNISVAADDEKGKLQEKLKELDKRIDEKRKEADAARDARDAAQRELQDFAGKLTIGG